MKCYKNNIPRFHPYCKIIELFCHSNNFNAVNTIGLIRKSVFTNARKWSRDTEMISHTNRNLSVIPHYPSFFLNALKISYIFYTYFNVMSITILSQPRSGRLLAYITNTEQLSHYLQTLFQPHQMLFRFLFRYVQVFSYKDKHLRC